MAIVKLESVEVTRSVGSNGAFAVAETITTNTGASFPKSWTVWAQGSDSPAVGSLVTVVGEFSAKTRTYPAPSGMKTAIDLNINNPEVTVLHSKKEETEGAPF
jgi:hypothetical protein